jgi:sugar transferase EpsL
VGKRLIDLIGSGLGLILLAPLLAVVALTVRVALGRPVLFRQSRPGLHGTPFVCYKFRTMAVPCTGCETDAERLSPFGRLLRASSLDELPQLWNVLLGNLSLVGPRPLLLEYLPLYDETERRRHEVRPGITGWAQVQGRNEISWKRRFEYDVWYADHLSLGLDLRILALTLGRVLRGRGVSQPGHATAESFHGHQAP